MGKKRRTPEQIVELLRAAEMSQEPVKQFWRKHELSTVSFYRWRAKYGGMEVAEAMADAGHKRDSKDLSKRTHG